MKRSFLFFAVALSLVVLVACMGRKRDDVQPTVIEEQPWTDANTVAEVTPEFPGGTDALLEYLRMKYTLPIEPF